MKMASITDTTSHPVSGEDPAFELTGFEAFNELTQTRSELEEILQDLICLCDDKAVAKLRKLERQLDEMVPSVTMIGQVKAGKTSLVNAMIGKPDFLPADVNPWTSVVTSLFLNTPRKEDDPKASFQLFNQDEWDHLIEGGGRLGELSRRANADDELEKVHAQIAEMREKTRQRLGRKFELLLGQKHDFDKVTEDLIQSYVCMGDEPGMAEAEDASNGRFADITKAADIFMEAPHIPSALCIRDTPGVNDTFLMREQITINALRGSRLCCVVLSAHQALTTTDMAMIRMISNVKSRDLVIFVNRIDELSNPAEQIDEIRDSIRKTLSEHNGPEEAQIVFGSAYWANLAVTETVPTMVDDSAAALDNLAEAELGDAASTLPREDIAWQLSGVPELFAALGDRIAEGIAAETFNAVRSQAANAANSMLVATSMVSLKLNGETVKPVGRDVLEAKLNQIEIEAKEGLKTRLSAIEADFSGRIERSRKRFLDRALEVLIKHLNSSGSDKTWQYSADGLRLLLRSSFLVLSKNYTRECGELYSITASKLADTYREAFDVRTEGFKIEPPAVPNVPPPVTLGATIALDLNTSWWKGWWQKRKGVAAQADHYYKLIEAETAPLIEQLDSAHVGEIRAAAAKTLEDFLDEQGGQLLDLCAQTELGEEDLKKAFGVHETEDRDEFLRSIIEDLTLEDE